jgi:DNA-binding NarL/FixJ family response regulator
MNPTKRITIMTVEDQPVFCKRRSLILAAQPDMVVVAEASAGDEALQQYCQVRPDLVSMDQRLPGASGTEALIAIRNQFPRARVIMLTTRLPPPPERLDSRPLSEQERRQPSNPSRAVREVS